MNHMKEVAKILGVQLGEEFKIDIHSIILSDNFYLTEKGLFMVSDFRLMREELSSLLNGEYEVVKLPILNDEEKKYLSYVIKPFRKDVLKIAKFESITSEYKEIISVKTKNGNMIFPAFEKGKMYKNMELNKEYSLKELGL